MRLSKILFRLLAVILTASLINSCVHHGWFEQPISHPPKFSGKMLQLIYPDNLHEHTFMTKIEFDGTTLKGTAFKGGNEQYAQEKNMIRAYLQPEAAFPDSLPSEFALPISQISKLEVYDLDLGRSVFNSTLVGLGVAGVIYALVFVLAILFVIAALSSSCPFVHAYDGEGYAFEGEIYGGAVFPSLEREDWLALPSLRSQDGLYLLKLANEAREIQHTNLAELQVVDHPQGTKLLADQAGNFHTIGPAAQPLAALSLAYNNVLPLLSERDEARFMGENLLSKDMNVDGVELSFANEIHVSSAKLVLRGRNSFWLEYTIGEGLDLFGDSYDSWYESQQTGDFAPQWIADQNIPLAVYVKRDGAWQLAERIPAPGPMADRDMVVPLDLRGIRGDEIEVKLEYGTGFWYIDYAGLDISPDQEFHQTTLRLDKATDQDGQDVSAMLLSGDASYLVQPQMGDTAQLSFAAPAAREGWTRSVFLHSQGHYKIIRESGGLPSLARINAIRKPGGLGKFSRELFQSLLESNRVNAFAASTGGG
jgi:hypothetical protein